MANVGRIDEPSAVLVDRVRATLGAKLTAYIGGADATSTVAE